MGYTITVTDSGQTPYTGATFTDDLTGVVDDAAYNADAAATAGTVSYASPDLTWTGNLAVGATATITYSVTVNNPDTGDIVLANTVTSAAAGSNCASGSTDPRCTATVDLVATKTLTFTKTANVASTTAGGVVDYTITATNSGLTAYSGATFTDDLTGVLANAAYNSDASATAGTVTYTSPDLTWTGTIPAGGIVTITYSVTVNNPDTGSMILANTISSTSPDSDCAQREHGSAVHGHGRGGPAADRRPGERGHDHAGRGGPLHLHFHQYRSGPLHRDHDRAQRRRRARLRHSRRRPDRDLRDADRDQHQRSWTGDIPVGGTVVITGTVTVDNPVPLNTVLTITDHHQRARQQLPVWRHRSALHGERHGADPGPDHHQDRERDGGGAGPAGGLHDHGDRLRADPVHRRDRDRLAGRGAGRRRLQRRREPRPPARCRMPARS